LYIYFIVFVSSMFKFFLGLAIGTGFHLPFLVTSGLAILGMMASVVLFTSFLGKYFHQWVLKTFYKNQKLFTKSNRRKITIWKKYGLAGVALLTPIIFTPIGGTMIANGFGESKQRIFLYMFVSAVLWSIGSSYIVAAFKYLPSFH
ncbi:MAG TPA: hypothetical protein VK766_00875, partial [Cytophagaceae bacterium]|nr:hypothetical protein [Cytophagaceae bacterium]